MDEKRRITLIDEDSHRRAEISRIFLSMRFHVEPFESYSELQGHWPGDGDILVHDADENIAHLAGDLPSAGVWLPIVAYDEAPEPDRIVDAILEGAIDYWTLPIDDVSVTQKLERARERTKIFGAARARAASARKRIECLSAREQQVLAGMASGMQNREMAALWGISPRTVEVHRAHLMSKLKVKSATDAVRIALCTSLSLDTIQ